ncbi:hypothetical protein GS682_11690 [Nostoc sp. B(2019)]|nr:hypothetical protein [Nostoc sp. B(2019)]
MVICQGSRGASHLRREVGAEASDAPTSLTLRYPLAQPAVGEASRREGIQTSGGSPR